VININNTQELKKIMDNIVSDALEETCQKLFDQLMLSLDKWIYNYHKPNADYARHTGDPTGEFRESWTTMQTHHGDTHTAIIFNEPETMSFDPYYNIHGSYLKGDLREDLAGILNEGTGGSQWYNSPRPYWDEFIKLLQNGFTDKAFQSALRKRGLTIKKTMSFADWSNKYSK
jgi:hypothetical protein